MDSPFAKVIKVTNDYEIVMNKGSVDDISIKDNFLIYNLGDELFDPDSNESLGQLEIVCGKAKVKHIQSRATTLISNVVMQGGKKIVRKSSPFSGILGMTTEEEVDLNPATVPFKDVAEGSLIKPI